MTNLRFPPAAARYAVSAALAATAFALPRAALAQDQGVRDHPRALEIFADVSGYTDLAADRYGVPASPRSNDLGFLLVLRMFQTVCLGLEQGADLDAVMPDGFASYHGLPYYFADPDAVPRGDTIVLSSTGDIDQDEAGGHPAIWLDPAATGMTCRLEWQMVEIPTPETQEIIVGILTRWMPWQLALVPASRPILSPETAQSDAIDWDRPCQDRWCPVRAYWSLQYGDLHMELTLNITGIGGERP